MVDNAGGHEQRGFEGGVVDDVKDGRHQRQFAVHAKQQGDQAEVADGGIGQQALHVVLQQGKIAAEEQGDETRAADQPEP